MAQEPTSVILTLVDGPVMLVLEKSITSTWKASHQGILHCPVGEAGYMLRFYLRTLTTRPSDEALVLEAASVDLEEARKRGASDATLPTVEAALRKTGWTRAPSWEKPK